MQACVLLPGLTAQSEHGREEGRGFGPEWVLFLARGFFRSRGDPSPLRVFQLLSPAVNDRVPLSVLSSCVHFSLPPFCAYKKTPTTLEENEGIQSELDGCFVFSFKV